MNVPTKDEVLAVIREKAKSEDGEMKEYRLRYYKQDLYDTDGFNPEDIYQAMNKFQLWIIMTNNCSQAINPLTPSNDGFYNDIVAESFEDEIPENASEILAYEIVELLFNNDTLWAEEIKPHRVIRYED